MITDYIDNASKYNLDERIARALEYIETAYKSGIDTGTYKIEGDDMYALVEEYTGKPKERGSWEAHRKYIDVQFIAEGRELIGHSDIHALKAIGDYDEEEDFQIYEGDGHFYNMEKGMFMILFPDDAHMPGVAQIDDERIKKIVVKVRCDVGPK